jgi:hypothetical protein
VEVSGSTVYNVYIYQVEGNIPVLSFSQRAGFWGFSPDDGRFAYWYIYNGMLTLSLYNLEASGGAQLIYSSSTLASEQAIMFSPSGRYFYLVTLNSQYNATLLLLDAQTGALRFTDTFTFFSPPGSPGDKFGVAGWGFSPDDKDRTFTYAYVSGQNSVEWSVVNLKTGIILHRQSIASISAFWKFSRCGDRLGLVDQPDLSYVRTNLYKTLDMNWVPGSSHTAPITDVVLTTTLSSHLAYIGGSTYTLGDNTAPAACPATPALDSISLSKSSVIGGNPVDGIVSLNRPAPAGGAAVHLSSDHPALVDLPDSVTIPASSLTAPFSVTTFEVSAPTVVTVTASYNGDEVFTILHLLVIPPVLTGITANPATINPGDALTVTVTLMSQAPEGGAVVNLLSSHPGLVHLPETIAVAEEHSSARIRLVPAQVFEVTQVTLTASLNGVNKTAQVTLMPKMPGLAGLQIMPSSIKGGNSAIGVITLTAPVPTDWLYVDISTDLPSVVFPESKPGIHKGAIATTFGINTGGVGEMMVATLVAELNGTTFTNTLEVQPADLASLSAEPACGVARSDVTTTLSIAGYPIDVLLTLDGYAPPEGAVIHLESSDPSLIQAPETVTIFQDKGKGSLLTSHVATPTLVTLIASYRGVDLQMPISLTLIPTYRATGLHFFPSKINDAGQIAGGHYIMDNDVVTDVNGLVDGSVTIDDLNEQGDWIAHGTIGGTLGNFYVEGNSVYTIAPYPEYAVEGMNDEGEVVGYWDSPSDPRVMKGIYWKKGETTSLLEFNPARPAEVAFDINNQGVMVGYSFVPETWSSKAERWFDLLFDPLNLPFDYGQAIAANESGTIVVNGLISPGSEYPYLWKEGNYTQVPVPWPVRFAQAVALNDNDDVLMHAHMFTEGEEEWTEPLIHNQDGTYMLNCAVNLDEDLAEYLEDGWKVTDAYDLNNQGQIVGLLETQEGNDIGIVLNPAGRPENLDNVVYLPVIVR